MTPLLEARISVDYPNKPGVLRDVRLDIGEGEILGLVGESGSGKSTISLALLRLLEHKGASIAGEILFSGWDLLRLRSSEMRRIRGRDIALVLQSPLASLNPALRIGTQMAEAWRAHKSGGEAKLWKTRALELFERVSLPAEESFLGSLSAPAQCGTSSASPDRHGRAAQAAPVDRRRAHQRARRHHAKRNPGSFPQLESRTEHGHALRLARSAGGSLAVLPHRHSATRPDCRNWRYRTNVSRSAH